MIAKGDQGKTGVYKLSYVYNKDTGSQLITATTDKSSLVLLSFELDKYESNLIEGQPQLKKENELLFGTNLLESVSIMDFDGIILMFQSACDFKVHAYQIYYYKNTNAEDQSSNWQFNFLNSLQGYNNKITSIDTVTLHNQETEGFIVTGSKDLYIKVWKVSQAQSQNEMELNMKKNIHNFDTIVNGETKRLYCHLESNLFGHNDSISSVR